MGLEKGPPLKMEIGNEIRMKFGLALNILPGYLKPKDVNYGFHSFEFRIARYDCSSHLLRQRHSECIRVRNGEACLDAGCR